MYQVTISNMNKLEVKLDKMKQAGFEWLRRKYNGDRPKKEPVAVQGFRELLIQMNLWHKKEKVDKEITKSH